jgi:hypothetical protein
MKLNPKPQILNSKQTQNPKLKTQKHRQVLGLEHLSLFRI